MSTHATVGYEADDGSYVGVYCQFDGYPDHTGNIMHKAGYDKVKREVERALLEAGLRTVDGWETYFDAKDECSGREEWLQNSWPCTEQSYNYRIRKDGSVDCCDHHGNVLVF